MVEGWVGEEAVAGLRDEWVGHLEVFTAGGREGDLLGERGHEGGASVEVDVASRVEGLGDTKEGARGIEEAVGGLELKMLVCCC